MIKIVFLLLGMLLIAGCANEEINMNSGSAQLITNLNVQVNSVEDAKQILSNWLNSETNFDNNSNKIELVNEYNNYYNLQLTTAISINGRESGTMGYRDYKLTKDGNLYGYYYSK